MDRIELGFGDEKRVVLLAYLLIGVDDIEGRIAAHTKDRALTEADRGVKSKNLGKERRGGVFASTGAIVHGRRAAWRVVDVDRSL
jgi:hypothetical protein